MNVLALTLKAIGVDEIGLDNTDREILSVIMQKFRGGPVGLNTLAAAISEEEPNRGYLRTVFNSTRFLERTARGRIVTKRAYRHLGVEFLG